ncbi:MAG: transporter substrate-binding domain-containing protein [Erysipelotrichaceae bacterium]|nr:transporter substrate-binding domain-containing protein [Erysipelotrichaceae bacterium]
MKRLMTIVLAALMVFGLAACGSKEEANTNTDTNTETNNVLRVGMECNYAPFNWTTLEAGEHTVQINSVDLADGYDVVMASMIAEQMGMELQIVKLEWDSLIPALNQGEIDLIIAGMTDTPTRREEISFTTPYYESDMVIIVKDGSEVQNVTDIQELAQYKVMGQQGTTYDEIIDQIEGIGANHLDPKADYPAMIPDLTAGVADAITAELPVAVGICTANQSLTYVTFAEGHGFDVDTSVSIGLRKGEEEFQARVQAALDTISAETRLEMMLAATDRQPAGE